MSDAPHSEATSPLNKAELVAWASFFVLLALHGFQSVGGYDLFWHMKAGELMVTQRTLISVDVFSFTVEGHPWAYKDLIPQVLFYLANHALGPLGLQIILVTVSASFFLLLIMWMRRQHNRVPFWSVFLMIIMLFYAMKFRIIVRPLLFSQFFLILYLFILGANSRALTEARLAKGIYLIPILQVVWINCHREALIGPVIVGIHSLAVCFGLLFHRSSHVIPIYWTRSKKEVLILAGISLLTIAACLTSTAGLSIFQLSTRTVTSSFLQAHIPNWGSLTPGLIVKDFPLYGIFILLTVVTSIANYRRIRGEHVVLGLFFLGLSLHAIRLIPEFVIMATFITIQNIDESKLTDRLTLKSGLFRWLSLSALILLILGLSFAQIMKKGALTIGFKNELLPVGAVDLLKREHTRGRIFNSLHFGGYIIYHLYPDVRVFIDGRSDTVYPLKIFEDLEDARQRGYFVSLSERYNFDMALLQYDNRDNSFAFLWKLPGWHLIYWDDVSVLFVKGGGPHEKLVDKYGIEMVNPFDPLKAISKAATSNEGWEKVHRELQRLVSDTPDSVRAHFLLAYFYKFSGVAFIDAFQREVAVIKELKPDFNGLELLEGK